MAEQIENIPIGLLHEPWILMRPVVKDSVEFLERRDSLRQRGFINSIAVRPSPRQPGKYEIIDGMWRFEAAKDIALDTIPCIIKTGLTDEDVLADQIQANAVRTETTPVEFSKQLRRILDRKPGMTFAELARIAGKNPTWVKDRLGLLHLSKDLQQKVDRGEIPIGSAYMLAKIPLRLRVEYVNEAIALPVGRFKLLAASVIKQFTECIQKGKMDARYLPEFRAQPNLRGIKEVKSELENPQVGATLLAANNCSTLTEAWNLCLLWLMHMDPQSIEEQRAEFTRRETVKHIEREAHHDPLDKD